jgi:uncharacterized protein (DUF1330 family)
MPAYLYASEEITDPAAHAEYRKQVPAILAAYGGRFLVRGGAVELLEGDAAPERVVIVEFPSMAQLKAFYDSPEYQTILSIRQRSAKSYLVAIEGLQEI